MKKARNSKGDEMRAEYKRSDFKKLERGKFYQKVVSGSNVVLLEPKLRKHFPIPLSSIERLITCSNWQKKSSRLKSRPRGKVARAG